MLIVEYSKINIYDGCEAKEKEIPNFVKFACRFSIAIMTKQISWLG